MAFSTETRPALLNQVLQRTERRYRIPATPVLPTQTANSNPADIIALAIEAARKLVAYKETPPAAIRHCFLDALSRLIQDAMREDRGDLTFQAMVLQYLTPQIQDYAELASKANEDQRTVRTAVNAIAHPAKQKRASSAGVADALAQLYKLAASCSWGQLNATARRILSLPAIADEPAMANSLERILEDAALQRLRSMETLEADTQVRQYLALRERSGPRQGSADAAGQGSTAKERGAAVETQTAQALWQLARRLDQAEGSSGNYKVVTSLCIPPSLLKGVERAKAEWDAVLLGRANAPEPRSAHGKPGEQDETVWNVLLLVEAKASIDAVATDLPRLLRGLRVLIDARADATYVFLTQQGPVRISADSLKLLGTAEDATSDARSPNEASAVARHNSLPLETNVVSAGSNPVQAVAVAPAPEGASLAESVLYCCSTAEESAPRLLSAASRMQLLSTNAALQFAAALLEHGRANPQLLEPIWHNLLTERRWKAVLNQYATLHQARELAVNLEDLVAAIEMA